MTIDQWIIMGVSFSVSLVIIIIFSWVVTYNWYKSPAKIKARRLKRIKKSQRQFSDW